MKLYGHKEVLERLYVGPSLQGRKPLKLLIDKQIHH